MTDGPAIAMKVEKGHLVPVAPFDVELLAQWREGAVLNVSPTVAIVRPLEKHYFAMLSRLLKAVETPWATVPEAHEAIKLALGFVEPIKRKTGEWGHRSRPIATFTNSELDDFFAGFCVMLPRRFKIDAAALNEFKSSDVSARAKSDDVPGAGPIPVSVGEAGGGLRAPTAPPPSAAPLADQHWLKTMARMLVSATEPNGTEADIEVLKRQAKAVATVTPGSTGEVAKGIGRLIYMHCLDACTGKAELDPKWIAMQAGCTVADLRPEAR